MNTEESRKEFEGWAESNCYILDLDEDGDYENNLTFSAFEAYQAAKAQAVPEWISVSDRLPFDGESVLIFDKGGTYGAIYTLQYYDDFILKHKCVTHWMPLPSAPEQQK